jgi:hypothetical protein
MMAENINFILLRTMLECNHQNGHRVRSLQIAWSGNFADYNRALEVLRGNNPTLFDNLILQVIDCHMRHRVAAANLSLPTIVISDNHTDDPCTVCLENFEESMSRAKEKEEETRSIDCRRKGTDKED